MNFYLFLADVLVVIHFAYVLFVVVGMLAILVGILRRWQWIRNFWFRAIHMLMILVVVAEEYLNLVCPLTRWENQLREAGGVPADSQTFVGRLVQSLMFFDAPWVWPIVYSAFGLAVVLAFVFAPPHWPRREKK